MLRKFENPQQLDQQLATTVATALAADIVEYGAAILVVSGGRTPQGFFHILSAAEIDWRRVTITLADERWVDTRHADSNEHLVRGSLCVNRAAAAEFISLKNPAATAHEGQSTAAKMLQQLGPFSLVLLGMGEDGHTASLFPGAKSLRLGLDLESGLDCLAVTPLAAPHERLSLSLPRLLDSREIILHLVGSAKAQTLAKVQAGSDIYEYPVRAILQQQRTAVDIFYAD